MTNQLLFKELTNIHTLMKLREVDEEQLLAEMVPFGFVDDGQDDDEPIPEKNWLWRKVEADWSW
jgi:hypothetical protein